LRALAVVAVFLYHASVPYCSGGYAGVDVFFALSGFLITGLILRERDAGAFSFAHFFERRARRILPAFFFAAAGAAALAHFALPQAAQADFSRMLLLSSVFASNFYFWNGNTPYTRINPLEHSWSLAVEEQFYLLFPPLLMLLLKSPDGRRRAFGGLTAIAVASLALSALDTGPAAYYQLPTRAWELLAGALLALRPPKGSRALQSAAAWLGLGAILLSFAVLRRDMPYSLTASILPCLGTLAFIWAGTENAPPTRLLALPPVAGLGRLSYAVYLWHWPALLLFSHDGHANPRQKLMAAGLVLFLALFSYVAVESPIRQRKRLPSRAGFAAFCLGCVLLLAGIAASGTTMQ
jgi:peptidoglycan/LPS O-acetylase OafA/YrhL